MLEAVPFSSFVGQAEPAPFWHFTDKLISFEPLLAGSVAVPAHSPVAVL